MKNFKADKTDEICAYRIMSPKNFPPKFCPIRLYPTKTFIPRS
eukprot:UN16835